MQGLADELGVSRVTLFRHVGGREALLSLNLADRRFGYPLEMVMNAAAAGWRVSEIEVTYLPRIGKSKVTGTVGGCVRTVRDMSQVLAQ